MSTQSNAIPGSSVESQQIAPAVVSVTRPMYWSVRRELWESRYIYIAPLAAAAVSLFGFVISIIHLPSRIRAGASLDPAQLHELIEQPYNFAALLIMASTFIAAVFYCLDALHGERRDRSILFWKSLPVSDFTTVLSKATIPVAILPLLTVAITVATQWIMLLLSTAVVLGSGLSAATLWDHLPLFQMQVMTLYHLLAIHALWYAPIYSWLLLASAWARRVVFLWAALPLLAIAAAEKIAFNTSHFGALLLYRLGDGVAGVPFVSGSKSMDPLAHLTPGHFLMSPGLWIGLGIAAAFLIAAARLRRYQGPI